MKILWTDGSAVPNPGKGGFAVIEEGVDGGRPVALGGGDNTTNIRMEAEAMIAAIEYAGDEPCEIHTDSEFWINVLTKWAPSWKKNDWHKASDKKFDVAGNFVGYKESSIKNLDLVKKLYEDFSTHDVTLVWVRGHVGNELNEMADEWANKAREGIRLPSLL